MEKTYQGFEGLKVYQAARAFRIKISQLAKSFPPEEKYTLKNQLLCSVRSISANIAEGYGRFHYPEFVQFCRIARGSLNETLDHLLCASDEGYIQPHDLENYKNDYSKLLRLLNGFYIISKNRNKTK